MLLAIDATGTQRAILMKNQARLCVRLRGALAAVGPVRLIFTTIGIAGATTAATDFAVLRDVLRQDAGKIRTAVARWSTTRLELRDALIAIDGERSGAKRREIANVIFGKPRVDADWSHPNRVLKDRIKRSIRRGRRLLAGAYRKLLS